MRFTELAKAPFIEIAKRYIQSQCESDRIASQRGSFIGGQNERSIEFSFALRALNEQSPKSVLDVGTGRTAWPHLLATCGFAVTAIDQIEDYWRKGLYNRHWPIDHDDIRQPKTAGKFDAITCLSVLEHIPEHASAVKGMFSLLNAGGAVIITVPFTKGQYHPNVYRDPRASYGKNNKYIAQVYSKRELDNWCTENRARVVTEEYYQAFTGELWTFGERIFPMRKVSSEEPHQLGCFVLQPIDQ